LPEVDTGVIFREEIYVVKKMLDGFVVANSAEGALVFFEAKAKFVGY